MKISEINSRNKKVLDKALRVEELLSNEDLSKDITEVDSAELYYLSTSSLTAQAKAPMGEKFLCNKLSLERVSSRLDRGDAVDSEGLYYELKNSFTNQAQNLNIRQIRLCQEVDYYYCFYINEESLEDSLFFVLTKAQMQEEVELCGGFTHGTVAANQENRNSEYSITISINSKRSEKTIRWKEKYLSEDLKNKILG